MYVSGLSSASFSSPTRTSAIWPANFARHEPACRRASSSTTIQPALCRFRACSRPGFPRPTTSSKEDYSSAAGFVAGGFRLGFGWSFLAGLALGALSPSAPSRLGLLAASSSSVGSGSTTSSSGR